MDVYWKLLWLFWCLNCNKFVFILMMISNLYIIYANLLSYFLNKFQENIITWRRCCISSCIRLSNISLPFSDCFLDSQLLLDISTWGHFTTIWTSEENNYSDLFYQTPNHGVILCISFYLLNLGYDQWSHNMLIFYMPILAYYNMKWLMVKKQTQLLDKG